MSPPRRAAAGFTLLEVMIGATLLSVMMVILTGSLRIGAESWDAGEERMARASRLFVVENFLRTHIESLAPVAGLVRNGQLEPSFRGTDRALNYVAAMPEQVNVGGLFRFQLYVGKNGESQDLRMAITTYTTNPDREKDAETIDDVPLVENIEHFAIAYLPRRNLNESPDLALPGGNAQDWTKEWAQNQLPAMIRIEIVPAGEEPWPTLVIAPRTLILR